MDNQGQNVEGADQAESNAADLRRLLSVDSDAFPAVAKATSPGLDQAWAEVAKAQVEVREQLDSANRQHGSAEFIFEQAQQKLSEANEAREQARRAVLEAEARAERIVADAYVRAQGISDRAAEAALVAEQSAAERVRQAEIQSAEIVSSAQQQVEQVIKVSTEARHGDIERLHALERSIAERIDQLLAENARLEQLPRAQTSGLPLREPGQALDEVIDLTETVAGDAAIGDGPRRAVDIDLTGMSAAIHGAIEDWAKESV